MLRPWLAPVSLSVALILASACASSGDDDTGPGGGAGWTTSSGGGGGTTSTGGSGGDGGGQVGGGGPWAEVCPTTFRFTPTIALDNPRIAGEWHGFDLATATPLQGPTPGAEHTAVIDLAPGLHAYKIVYDANNQTEWIFDPEQGRRKYVGGEENSAMLVPDCNLPSLVVTASQSERPSPGQGSYHAVLAYHDAIDESGPAPADFVLTQLEGEVETALPASSYTVADDGQVTIDLTSLSDGKTTLLVRAATQSGRLGEPLRLVFWIEAEDFDWRDAIIYMVVTDRFANGDASNDPDPTPGADPRGDWQGGDLEGVRQAIANGTLDELGVRAIWLTPFNTNPDAAYLASDGQTQVTGYHGYWPTRAREVDPRLGGAAALEAMVAEAHDHGIRVLMDFVVNHVHEAHEYVAQHPDWFRTGCVCGTPGCDWTGHALDCMFRDYMPDIDHTVPEANAQFVDDAVWWVERFDLDGLRVDAVKHVEEVATRNLAAAVREGFEAAGTRYFLMGETAMGWNDCADPCNDDNYGTIAKYVGPHGLDGQFDFVLYHGVSYRTFAYGDNGMLHADYWLQHGLSKWPAGAIMTPYIGSHDTPRFTSLADYRGQDGAHDRSIPSNQWSNTAVAPSDAEPYRRTRIGMSWVLLLPGAPLLYYGDEYGQWGGADPNNRMMWSDPASVGGDETTTLLHVRRLGQARRELVALRRGDYLSLFASDDTLVFARAIQNGPAAVVGLTRLPAGDTVNVSVASLGINSGTVLADRMGGPDVTVSGGGTATFTIPGSGAVVLAP